MNGIFEGIIQKVNKPKSINKHSVWSISLKKNGQWISVWRKHQSKADEEALSKPTLSRVVNYYIQQQRNAGANGYCQEEERLNRNLKKCWLKSFKKYHRTEMDLF